MKPSFIITGDSWSQGEWDGYPTDYKTTHGGVHQYLVEAGYTVENVGRGGYNNNESLEQLRDRLKLQTFNYGIFFFTDPLRQSSYEEFSTLLPSTIITNHVNNILSSLDNLVTEFDIDIVVIGGCAKLIVKDYQPTNIKLIVPSLNELLVPEFVDSEFMDSQEWTAHWLKLKSNCDVEQKSEILNVYDQAQKKFNLWNSRKDLYWPDGLHANRIGHRQLFDYLITQLNLN